jgi:hypothetical protein
MKRDDGTIAVAAALLASTGLARAEANSTSTTGATIPAPR